jgi:ComF family protein
MPWQRSILARLASLARGVEALALPRGCLGCGRAMPAGDATACCALCRHRMRAIAPPVCGRCGQPRDPWSLRLKEDRGHRVPRGRVAGGAARPEGRVACAFCREWPEALAWAVSAVWMEDGPARNLVHALKYDGWRVAAPAMAWRMAAGGWAQRVDLLVPVPLGRTRERARGHNQAALLADALGRATGLAVSAGVLRRCRETRSQTRLPPTARWRNVRGAFAAAGRPLSGLRVALVDDVLTTGATLGAAAQALAVLEPETIGALTFARARVPA